MMSKRNLVLWLVPATLTGMMACSGADLDEPVRDEAPEQLQSNPAEASEGDELIRVTAWVPGTPKPVDSHQEGSGHTLVMDWVHQEETLSALTDHSALIVRGQVESTRSDVIRTYPKHKDEALVPEEARESYTDLPVTIATVRVEELGRATHTAQAVAEQETIEVMFAGGLLSDGCILEPDDNPLPKVGEEAIFFLNPQHDPQAPNGGAAPLATGSIDGLYGITGGPAGRVLVEDGLVAGSPSPQGNAAIEKHVGKPVGELLDLVRARAATSEYVPPQTRREAPVAPEATDTDHQTELGWCGVPSFGYKWCRHPSTVTYTDYASWRWPVGDALNEWMYTRFSNSLYLQWRAWGQSDVMVYENWYGYNGWYGYAWNGAWNGCMGWSIVNLNNTYYTGWHYAKTVATHEVGHTIGITHHWNCSSIMYTNPVACGSSITYCDEQAATQMYPY